MSEKQKNARRWKYETDRTRSRKNFKKKFKLEDAADPQVFKSLIYEIKILKGELD
jgi:hypothetical protein